MNNGPTKPPPPFVLRGQGRVPAPIARRSRLWWWLVLAVLWQPLLDNDNPSAPGWTGIATAEPRRPQPFRTDLASVRDMEVEVVRGQSVDIILSATVPTTQTPDFFLRSQPEIGSLGELERVPGQPLRARVRYTVPAGSSGSSDQFTFAARLPGGPMSASAAVRIRIIEPQPLMDGESLVMENVPLGQAQTGMLVVTNRGDGPWRGVVRLPEPWSAPTELIEVQPGQRMEVPIRFRPTDLEIHRHEFFWQPERPDEGVLLVGRGVPEFSLRPGRHLSLVLDPETGARSGRLRIDSLMPVTVRLSSSDAGRIGLPDELQLSDDQPVEVPLTLAADDLAALTTTITVASEFTNQSLEVVADAIPGRLQLGSLPEHRVLDLGTMKTGEETSRTLTLRNIGGAGLRLRIEAERPAFVSQPVGSSELAAGRELDLVVGLRPTSPGPTEPRISIDTGAGVETFTLLADVHAPDTDPAEVVVPRMGGGTATWQDILTARQGGKASQRWAISALVEGVRLESPKINEYLPQITALRATAVGRTWVDLQWPVPSYNSHEDGDRQQGNSDLDYMIEIGRVMPHPTSGEAGHFWLPVSDRDFKWKTSRDRQTVVARLRNLPRQSPVTVRVAVRDDDGAVGPVSPTARAITGGNRPLPWRGLGFILLFITAAVLGFLVWRQRRSP